MGFEIHWRMLLPLRSLLSLDQAFFKSLLCNVEALSPSQSSEKQHNLQQRLYLAFVVALACISQNCEEAVFL